MQPSANTHVLLPKVCVIDMMHVHKPWRVSTICVSWGFLSVKQLDAYSTQQAAVLQPVKLLPTCSYLPSSRRPTSLRQRMSLGGSSASKPGGMLFKETAQREKPNLRMPADNYLC